MADVTLYPTCTSFEPAGQTCRLTGLACPRVAGGVADFAACPDATFVARVSMPPDEFQVLLTAEGHPALGTLAVVRCRRPELHHGVAGVHVNAVLETRGDEAMLRPRWHMDGSVEFSCPATDVRILWRDGKFIPL